MPHFDGQHQKLIQAKENRHLQEYRQTSGKRIGFFILVQLHNFLLHLWLVVFMLVLQRLHLGLDHTHLCHGRELFLRNREHEYADHKCQADNRCAETTKISEQEMQDFEEGFFDDAEPAPIDGIIHFFNAQIIGISIEYHDLFCAGKQPRCLRKACTCRNGGLLVSNHLGLIYAAARTHGSVNRCFLIGDQRSKPVLIGKANPAARRAECLLTVFCFV